MQLEMPSNELFECNEFEMNFIHFHYGSSVEDVTTIPLIYTSQVGQFWKKLHHKNILTFPTDGWGAWS